MKRREKNQQHLSMLAADIQRLLGLMIGGFLLRFRGREGQGEDGGDLFLDLDGILEC